MIREIRAASTLPSAPISAQISDALIANPQVSTVLASPRLERDPSQVRCSVGDCSRAATA